MNYQAVIFDLDGVICHTDNYHYQAWKQMADREGIYFDESINSRLRGVSRMASLEIILERAQRTYTAAEKEALAAEKNEIYRQLLMNMSPADLSQDVAATLRQLKDAGVKIAIGSSSRNAKTILRQIGIFDWFDAISDGENITRSKPDPEVFVKAAGILGLAPSACLVVEDADAGIRAAHDGGFHSAGMGDACGNDEATYSIIAFHELSDIVLGKRMQNGPVTE
ncbi:beta-phosphoglucomutase [Feifania hominis]|uniref:Beta-phosphoglucomutase n=1 Tax=Feifania hominis TaxID=2763660 RepID=A0A926DFC3_9FIRM|nr:beta-phosphoglucomutase [Feifania hominis]MBC8537151.1 beta-phosphoglucomutase [Feifania hominis]